MWMVVTAIPIVDVDEASLHADELLHLDNYRPEWGLVEGMGAIAGSC